MTGWRLFLSSWDFEPPFVIGCALAWLLYLYAVRFQFNARSVNFTLGVSIVFLALVSPVDKLGEDYLFSAHMLQHMMLGLFAPPFLVAGLPESLVRSCLRFPPAALMERILGYPPLSLLMGVSTFWVWHFPQLYNRALENDAIHAAEHLCFLLTGMMLWWPIFTPLEERRLAPLPSLAYLLIAAVPGTILGVLFTLADTPYYAPYAHPQDELGALKLIRDDWGLTQLEDQKLGGAIMWEPMGAVFLWAMMMKIIDWFKQSDSDSPGRTNGDT